MMSCRPPVGFFLVAVLASASDQSDLRDFLVWDYDSTLSQNEKSFIFFYFFFDAAL